MSVMQHEYVVILEVYINNLAPRPELRNTWLNVFYAVLAIYKPCNGSILTCTGSFIYPEFYLTHYLDNLQIWTSCLTKHITTILFDYQNDYKSYTRLKFWLKSLNIYIFLLYNSANTVLQPAFIYVL